MIDVTSRNVRNFRWIVLALVIFYAAYQLTPGNFDYFGGPFRFLTYWGLFLSIYTAIQMLRISYRRTTRHFQTTMMVVAVINTMVIFLYWRLFLIDPALVQSSEAVWWREYYYHALGPGLQIIDALFIARAFRRPWRAIAPLLAIVIAFVLWGELFLQRFNSFPNGSVTSGLPYPFLNNMELAERIGVYMGYCAMALIALAILTALGWFIRRKSANLKPS